MPTHLKLEAIDAFCPIEDQLKASRYGKSVAQALRAFGNRKERKM